VLSPDELSAFARVCTTIADEIADQYGFVSVRALLARFQAQIVIRPLLVEGMIAALPGDGSGSSVNRWAVLIDSDTYSVTEPQIDRENSTDPLPTRLRFTIAHELAHSLAFRFSEFGVRLRNPIQTDAAKKAVVEAIEGVTDRLAPLLLLPQKDFEKFLEGRKEPPSVSEFAAFRRAHSVSRPVLISRLRLLSHPNITRTRSHLNNVAIFMGEWLDAKNALLRSWPMFVSFERNVVPGFLINLAQQDLSARGIFPETFALCGGESVQLDMTIGAGTSSTPDAEQLSVRCEFEEVRRVRGATFLCAVHRRGSIPAQSGDSSVALA
jgi:hypothetical protein